VSSMARSPLMRRLDVTPMNRLFPDLNEVRRSMDDVFARWFGETPLSTFSPVSAPPAGFQPAVDLWETDDAFKAHINLPGVKKEDLDIEVTGETLTVRGERKPHDVGENVIWHARAIGCGQFELAYTLPVSIDASKVKAEFVNGVLDLTLPKVESAKTKAVKVKVSE
jgi:HSP20 family protein